MKTEEDEAFDDLARRQGSWGGGFKAKRAMAADKLQEPVGMLHIDRLDKWLDASLKERKQREWVGLTDEELLHIGVATGLERAAVEMISNKLKEKNFD